MYILVIVIVNHQSHVVGKEARGLTLSDHDSYNIVCASGKSCVKLIALELSNCKFPKLLPVESILA